MAVEADTITSMAQVAMRVVASQRMITEVDTTTSTNRQSNMRSSTGQASSTRETEQEFSTAEALNSNREVGVINHSEAVTMISVVVGVASTLVGTAQPNNSHTIRVVEEAEVVLTIEGGAEVVETRMSQCVEAEATIGREEAVKVEVVGTTRHEMTTSEQVVTQVVSRTRSQRSLTRAVVIPSTNCTSFASRGIKIQCSSCSPIRTMGTQASTRALSSTS